MAALSVERGSELQTIEDGKARKFIQVLKRGDNAETLVDPIGGGPIIEPTDILKCLSLCGPIRKMAPTAAKAAKAAKAAAAKAAAARTINTCCVILGAHAASVVQASQDTSFHASYTKSVMNCSFGKVGWGQHIAGCSSFTSGIGAHFLLHADIIIFLRNLFTEVLYDSVSDQKLIHVINRCINVSQNKFKKSVEERVLFDKAGNFSVKPCYTVLDAGITRSASFLKDLFIKDNLYELTNVDVTQSASYIDPHRVVTINLKGDPYLDENGKPGVTDDIMLNILFKFKVFLADGSVYIIPMSFDRKAFLRERHRAPGAEDTDNIHFLSFELIEYLLTKDGFMTQTLPTLLRAQFVTIRKFTAGIVPDILDQIIRSLGNPISLCVYDTGCKGVQALIEGETLRTIDDQQQYGLTDSDGNPALLQFGDDNKIKEMLVFGDTFLRNPHGLKMAQTYADSSHKLVDRTLSFGVGKVFDSLEVEGSRSPPVYLPSVSPPPERSIPPETQATIESEYSGSKNLVQDLLKGPSAEAGVASSPPVVSSYRNSLAQLFFNAINWITANGYCSANKNKKPRTDGGKSRKLRRGRSFGRMKPRTSRRSRRRRSSRRSSKN